MNTKIALSVLVIAIILIGVGVLFFTKSASASNSLANLTPNDAMAYRYTAMAQYYEQQSAPLVLQGGSNASISNAQPGKAQTFSAYPLYGVDLTTLSPVDAMTFRYQALAYFYATHPNAMR